MQNQFSIRRLYHRLCTDTVPNQGQFKVFIACFTRYPGTLKVGENTNFHELSKVFA